MSGAKAQRVITPGRIAFSILLAAGLYLILIAVFDTFQYWPYFRLFLLCVMGFAFLIISYILKHG